MGACLKVLKCISCCLIVIVNMISLILSLVITGLGGILLFGIPLLKQYLIPMMENMMKELPDEVKDKIDIADMLSQIMKYLEGAGSGLFVAGVVLLAVSFVGCCGACCGYKILLLVYAIAMGVVTVGFLTITIMAADNEMFLFDQVDNIITTGIKKEFKGFNGMDNAFTTILSFVHMNFQCCGAKNGSDFEEAASWNRTYTVSQDYGGFTYSRTYNLTYPISCCKTVDFKPIDYNCIHNATEANSNYMHGCMTVLENMVGDYMSYMSYALWGLTGFLGILCGCAIIMFVALSKDSKVSPL